ncbi:hypothetical protein GCM10010521_11830 [Streptomyces rameus]|uniref:SDR family oxidoreductase n=1 Tax=Streptomyces rameus TaxID=68261 RepID=A0ABP6MXA5_9ACTN
MDAGLDDRVLPYCQEAQAVVWGERGARVNCISPGIILTPLARDEMSGPGSEGYHRMIETSAAGRVGTPTRSPRRRRSSSAGRLAC